jgi:hypothetical protein
MRPIVAVLLYPVRYLAIPRFADVPIAMPWPAGAR